MKNARRFNFKPFDRFRHIAALVALAMYPWLVGFDLSRHLVPPSQILDGGPPKDGIPAILEPKFVQAGHAPFLESDDRIVGVIANGEARAYPLKILNWHEVVDDSVGQESLAITYCPLTGSAIAYDRSLAGKPLTIGVSGKLYESNLLFYDRGTESLWSQIEGRAIAGPMTGRQLKAIPSVVTTWAAWRRSHPDTLVLDVNTGYSRDYGVDPYQAYANSDDLMFPVTSLDSRLPAKEIVLGLTINGKDEAFPFLQLASAKSPFSVNLGGSRVTIGFDASTHTVAAAVLGKHIPGYVGYWFAWAAFHPNTALWSEAQHTSQNATPSAAPGHPAEDSASLQSGVYGFSGTVSSFGKDKRAVIGECIWIYDRNNKHLIASGSCPDNNPGNFRVPLPPGQYVVRGPGGNRAVKVKQHAWARVDSLLTTPPGIGR